MTKQQEAFYRLWQAVSWLSSLDDFPIGQLDDEDMVLAENMVAQGLDRLMNFKTQLLNAKHELQTSDLQRGVLPQTEEGKEGVCFETDTDKEKKFQFIKGWSTQCAVRFNKESHKADFGEKESSAITVQDASGNFFDIERMRGKFAELHESSNGDTPSTRERK